MFYSVALLQTLKDNGIEDMRVNYCVCTHSTATYSKREE